MKKLLLFILVLWGGGAGAYWYWNDTRAQHVTFRTVAVRRGNLDATINATGTIEPEEVVDVGAQVAGEIISFGADPRDPAKPISYGSPVEKGTVLARLDDSLFKARVDQARASLKKAEADVEQAQAKLTQTEHELSRNQKLQSRGPGMVSAQDVDLAQANYDIAKAALAVNESEVDVARANLEEATANLGYTTIRSPVKGVILDRRVNIGQTVIASLNAPSLFLIAKDLSRMEIWASVNETDIGSIHVGQPVKFTVGAFPKDTFEGKVAQIRLNANMVQNVVTYTVAVAFDNADGKLLPYLTARLRFEVESRRDVLCVPKAALRWRPKVEHVLPSVREEYARSLRTAGRDQEIEPARPADAQATATGTLWVVQGDFVRPVPVQVGLSDGVACEVSGEGLHDGSEVAIGVERRDDADDLTAFLPHTRTGEKPKEKADAVEKSK